MSLTVLDPGPYSLLVDRGRPASRSLGVPVGGAADRAALALGNALIGNPPDAVALELTLAGPTLRAEHPTAGVVFGAPFTGPVLAGTTFQLQPGDVLKIGGTPEGVRGYLCVAGGFNAPTVLGSRSALETIRAGDVLDCAPSSATPGRSLPFLSSHPLTPSPPHPLTPSLPNALTLRALDGPQADWFPDGRFFETTYTVTPASNRMGLRLAGEPLTRKPGELVSEPVAPGAVQVTNDGLPVVLGVDGQTIGGYPKVAHVIRADLDALAQLRPGTTVRFKRVSPDEAEAAARERAEWLREWLTRLEVTHL
ncbi:MAG TPA: biotin-dependent carboxyltransferase family protein [Fimbriiglobus sp.]|nr:biotin-dependent carboxyltransferase family protein [Fimbriiglobus sp.]